MRINKSVGLVLCLMAIGGLFAGCTTTSNLKAEKEAYVAPTDLKNCQNFEDAAKKMVASVIDGIFTGNYALYSRDFSEKNKKYFDKDVFEKAHIAVKEELGEYKGEKFIGSWRKGDYEILLWKTRFSKTEDDILIQMYVKKVDGAYKIAALKLI